MPRVTKPLTNTEIERAKPQGKSYTLTDGNGLFLLISATGSKTWQFNYYRPITNKRTKFSIGSYPGISLSQARAKREEFRALLANGVDPQVKAKEEKQAINTQIENSFLSVAEKWKVKKALEIEPLTLKKNWRRLETYVFLCFLPMITMNKKS